LEIQNWLKYYQLSKINVIPTEANEAAFIPADTFLREPDSIALFSDADSSCWVVQCST
jgi:hypothetical protein